MLINHREHQVKEIYKSDDVHAFEVVILDLNKIPLGYLFVEALLF